jgi:hypothetical protein
MTGTTAAASVSQHGSLNTSQGRTIINTTGPLSFANGVAMSLASFHPAKTRQRTVAPSAKMAHGHDAIATGVETHSHSHHHARTETSGFAPDRAGQNGNPTILPVKIRHDGAAARSDTTDGIGSANAGLH